jgi:hypothetical protein
MNNQQISANTLLHRASGIVFSKLDDEMLAIDAEAGYCYSMNVTAERIWQLLDNPLSAGELCHRLCEEFAVDIATCQSDVFPLLSKLSDAGLIKLEL